MTRRTLATILPGLAACMAVLYLIWIHIAMTLTKSDVRCSSTTCDIRGRCLRALDPAPLIGGMAADFSTGTGGCVGKFVPAPIQTSKAPEARVHDHPGGAL